VKDLLTGRVEITAQNHGFAVDPKSVEKAGLVETHTNLNDGTSEGMRPPRAAPSSPSSTTRRLRRGLTTSHYLFARFIDLMKGGG